MDSEASQDVERTPGPAEVMRDAAVVEAVARALGEDGGKILTLRQLTVGYARRAIVVCAGNRSRAAEALGLSRSGLYRLLKAGEQ